MELPFICSHPHLTHWLSHRFLYHTTCAGIALSAGTGTTPASRTSLWETDVKCGVAVNANKQELNAVAGRLGVVYTMPAPATPPLLAFHLPLGTVTAGSVFEVVARVPAQPQGQGFGVANMQMTIRTDPSIILVDVVPEVKSLRKQACTHNATATATTRTPPKREQFSC